MNKQKGLGIFVVVLLASGGWFYSMRQHQRKQIEALVSESHQYVESALKADDLIRKGNWNVASVPVSKAESLICRQGALN